MKIRKNSIKTFTFLSVMIFVATLSYGQKKVDDCPDFEIPKAKKKYFFNNNGHTELSKWIMSPSGIIKINFSGIETLGVGSYTAESIDGGSADETTQIKYPSLSEFWGYSIAMEYERRLGRKTSLQIAIGYTTLSKCSFPVSGIHYPTVNMDQYIHGSYWNNQTFDNYDRHKSNDISIACDYRFYFKESLRKSYLSPFLKIQAGKSEYEDFDQNPNNINYGFKQKNLVFSLGIKYGYQWIIKKHYFINPSVGLAYLKGIDFKHNYHDSNATDEGLKYKYPNTGAIQKNYRLGYMLGLSIGYKF